MVEIEGKRAETIPAAPDFSPNALQQDVFHTMQNSAGLYRYEDPAHLIAELKVRNGIVQASRDLDRSRMSFKVFRDSMANPEYWRRTLIGGFQLKSGVRPSDAIRDIYANGALYGTECSTAMIIVLYKALADVLPKERFDRLYSDIYLMNWEHLDRDLALVILQKAQDELPGDGKYFINPDVDPLTPEWQGENAYYLGNGLYYGHGIGIADAPRIIGALNGARKKDATVSAYKIDSTKRQDYPFLSKHMK